MLNNNIDIIILLSNVVSMVNVKIHLIESQGDNNVKRVECRCEFSDATFLLSGCTE